jgi:hypothetical protein
VVNAGAKEFGANESSYVVKIVNRREKYTTRIERRVSFPMNHAVVNCVADDLQEWGDSLSSQEDFDSAIRVSSNTEHLRRR